MEHIIFKLKVYPAILKLRQYLEITDDYRKNIIKTSAFVAKHAAYDSFCLSQKKLYTRIQKINKFNIHFFKKLLKSQQKYKQLRSFHKIN